MRTSIIAKHLIAFAHILLLKFKIINQLIFCLNKKLGKFTGYQNF